MDTRLRSPDARTVVALLATRGRFDLLARRALPSMRDAGQPPDSAQLRRPDLFLLASTRL